MGESKTFVYVNVKLFSFTGRTCSEHARNIIRNVKSMFPCTSLVSELLTAGGHTAYCGIFRRTSVEI